MKLFRVIQAGNDFVVKADEMEYGSGGAFLLRSNKLVFAGPSAFTTLIIEDEPEKADVP